jgi:hypothetical protein
MEDLPVGLAHREAIFSEALSHSAAPQRVARPDQLGTPGSASRSSRSGSFSQATIAATIKFPPSNGDRLKRFGPA